MVEHLGRFWVALCNSNRSNGTLQAFRARICLLLHPPRLQLLPQLHQLAQLKDLLLLLLAQTNWPGYCPAYLYLAPAGQGVLIQLGQLLEPLQLCLLELTP